MTLVCERTYQINNNNNYFIDADKFSADKSLV